MWEQVSERYQGHAMARLRLGWMSSGAEWRLRFMMTHPVDGGVMADETKKALLKATLVGAAAAVLANVVLFNTWRAVVGPFMVAENPDSPTLAPLKLGFVVISSILPAFAAGGLYALILRFNRQQAFSIFMSLALLVLVISMVPVAKVPTDGLGTQLGLALLHLVAAVCITVPLVRAGKSLPAPAGSSA